MLHNSHYLDESYSVTALWGTSSRYRPCIGGVELIKNDERKVISKRLFDSMFLILDEESCALKEDCAYFRISNNGVTLINHRGAERVVSFHEFRNSYRFL